MLLFSNVRLAVRAGLEMRKPRSCSFEASKRDALNLEQLLYVWGTRRWKCISQQQKHLQVSPHMALGWVCRLRDGCPK